MNPPHIFWHHCGSRSFALLPPQEGVIECWAIICGGCAELISVEPELVAKVTHGAWS